MEKTFSVIFAKLRKLVKFQLEPWVILLETRSWPHRPSISL